MSVHVPGKRDEQDEMLYGFFHLDDPRDFFPDEESCTPEEIAAHKTACAKAESGEQWDTELVAESMGTVKIDGHDYANVCSSRLSFGIGSYVIHRDEEPS